MPKITLRSVLPSDLPILFQQQLDPEAVAMSAYPAKDRGEFMRHWEGIMKNKNVIARTIVYKEKVAGHIICWKEGKYEQRIGYWIGKEFWRRGIASTA
ncbi:MAG TPA: GNAT family N-acetyltransferase, partial [Anaerolineales bacterium]|nr:GNAT family N-acetyltransferase [Anaerolineales bacterium]